MKYQSPLLGEKRFRTSSKVLSPLAISFSRMELFTIVLNSGAVNRLEKPSKSSESGFASSTYHISVLPFGSPFSFAISSPGWTCTESCWLELMYFISRGKRFPYIFHTLSPTSLAPYFSTKADKERPAPSPKFSGTTDASASRPSTHTVCLPSIAERIQSSLPQMVPI